MSRRKKWKRKQKEIMKKSHSSLNPEFDEANEAILEEISKSQVIELICEICGAAYEYNNHNKPGMYCVVKTTLNTDCGGQIWVDKDMIKLPVEIKNGKKYHGSTGVNTTSHFGGGVWESHKHYGDDVIFEFDGKKLYASNQYSIDEKSGKWDLIIDLAGVVTIPRPSEFIRNDSPKRFHGLKPYLDVDEPLPSEVLRLFWTDMSIPPCGVDFWIKLWEMLPEKTVIACMGGHGRTGTCIVSLMIAAGEDFYEALEHVRKEHCHKAVETLSQEKYLHCIYIEMLQKELKLAREKNDLTLIKDIVEDIEFATKNPPLLNFKKDDKKTGEQQTPVPFNQQSTKVGSSSGEKVCNCDVISSYVNPCPIHAVNPEWAKDLDQNIRVVGDIIYVEECVDKLCMQPNCKVLSHQGWVEWDFTEVGVL